MEKAVKGVTKLQSYVRLRQQKEKVRLLKIKKLYATQVCHKTIRYQ